MFSSLCVVLSVFSLVSGYVVPRATPPSGWDYNALEDYDTYHCRYISIGCQNQHGTTFFDTCCHPLLTNETTSSLPAQCQMPQGVSCTNGEPVTASGTYSGGDCGGEPTSSPAPAPTYAPSPTESPSSVPPSAPPPTLSPSAAPPTPTSSSAAPPSAAPPTPTSSSPAPPSAPSPTSTTSQAAPPTTTTPTLTPTPTPASTSNPANVGGNPPTTPSSPAPTGSGSEYSGGIATYFYQNGVAGACGQVHSDTDMICALDTPTYAGGAHCGQQVQITNTQTGKTVVVTVADECPTCNNAQSIDLSEKAFEQLASLTQGTFPISWSFV